MLIPCELSLECPRVLSVPVRLMIVQRRPQVPPALAREDEQADLFGISVYISFRSSGETYNLSGAKQYLWQTRVRAEGRVHGCDSSSRQCVRGPESRHGRHR